jgi:cytochrome c biogenesis protein CcmG/thiol:disulfide interchange protein DsbE
MSLHVTRIIIGSSVLLAVSFAVAGCDGKGASSAEGAQHPLIGNPAPDFTVDAVPGSKGKLSLASFQGKVVIVDFWGTFCDPCKQSFPKLQELNTKYGAQGVEIMGVSVDGEEKKAEIPPFLTMTGAKFDIGQDPDGDKVASQYHPPTMPSSFVIDKKGVVRFVHSGWHDGEQDELDKEIKQLVSE